MDFATVQLRDQFSLRNMILLARISKRADIERQIVISRFNMLFQDFMEGEISRNSDLNQFRNIPVDQLAQNIKFQLFQQFVAQLHRQNHHILARISQEYNAMNYLEVDFANIQTNIESRPTWYVDSNQMYALSTVERAEFSEAFRGFNLAPSQSIHTLDVSRNERIQLVGFEITKLRCGDRALASLLTEGVYATEQVAEGEQNAGRVMLTTQRISLAPPPPPIPPTRFQRFCLWILNSRLIRFLYKPPVVSFANQIKVSEEHIVSLDVDASVEMSSADTLSNIVRVVHALDPHRTGSLHRQDVQVQYEAPEAVQVLAGHQELRVSTTIQADQDLQRALQDVEAAHAQRVQAITAEVEHLQSQLSQSTSELQAQRDAVQAANSKHRSATRRLHREQSEHQAIVQSMKAESDAKVAELESQLAEASRARQSEIAETATRFQQQEIKHQVVVQDMRQEVANATAKLQEQQSQHQVDVQGMKSESDARVVELRAETERLRRQLEFRMPDTIQQRLVKQESGIDTVHLTPHQVKQSIILSGTVGVSVPEQLTRVVIETAELPAPPPVDVLPPPEPVLPPVVAEPVVAPAPVKRKGFFARFGDAASSTIADDPSTQTTQAFGGRNQKPRATDKPKAVTVGWGLFGSDNKHSALGAVPAVVAEPPPSPFQKAELAVQPDSLSIQTLTLPEEVDILDEITP